MCPEGEDLDVEGRVFESLGGLGVQDWVGNTEEEIFVRTLSMSSRLQTTSALVVSESQRF